MNYELKNPSWADPPLFQFALPTPLFAFRLRPLQAVLFALPRQRKAASVPFFQPALPASEVTLPLSHLSGDGRIY